MRKILMLLLTAAMCLTACGKDAPLPEVPVESEAPPAAAAPEAVPVPAPATPNRMPRPSPCQPLWKTQSRRPRGKECRR